MKKTNLAITLSMSTILTALVGVPAFAQIDEIVVTAQKREQNQQDVPVAVTAINDAAIEKLGITATTDLVRIAPSLTAIESNDKTNSSFSIRGIGTNLFGISAEQAVSMIIDDVAMPQQGQSISNLVDIERIEVLRGPQSTLFGKAASAGVINIVTKGPTDEFEGTAEVTVTDENLYQLGASVSGPIADNIGYRVSGHYFDRDGYQENLTEGQEDLGGEDGWGVRGKLQWDATDALTVQLGGYYSDETSQCCARTFVNVSPGARVLGLIPATTQPGPFPAFANDIPIGPENTTVRIDNLPDATTESRGINLRVTAELGEYTLQSITAKDFWDYQNTEDVDFGDYDLFGALALVGFAPPGASGGSSSTSVRDVEFFSQELRLLSPQRESYDYILGLYYSDIETDRTFVRDLPVAPVDSLERAGTEYLGVFGQFNWHASDRTTASLGLRYFEETISGEFTNFLGAGSPPIGGSAKDDDIVGKLSIQHDVSDTAMVYASYSKGYKGQLYDLRPEFNQSDIDNPVESESSDAYEIGLKSRLLDNRLQFNLSAFLTNYDNYQVQTAEFITGVAVFEIRNAGELKTKGIELETLFAPTDRLTFTFNAAYVDAEVNNLNGAPCFQGQTPAQGCVGGVQDIDGGALPNSPELKTAIVAEYRAPLASSSLEYFGNISHTWQDDIQFGLTQQPDLIQDDYGITNLRLGVGDQDGKYEVSVFVNNAFDTFYRGDMLDPSVVFAGTGTAQQHVVTRNSQRYFGAKAKVNF